MLVKFYSIYDSVAKEHVRTITAQNDQCAERAVDYLVREKTFDKLAGKDYVLVHVYDFDTSSGKVSNNDVRTICAFASAMAKFEAETLTNNAIEAGLKVGGKKDGAKKA